MINDGALSVVGYCELRNDIRDTSVTDELVQWILQYGSGARVLNPAHLKDKIKQELLKSLEQYS